MRVSDDETNPLCGILKLSGAVKEEGGLLNVRNRIYDRVFDREWVTAHMPDAELRRQRAAYRRGVVRAASVSIAVLLVVLGLALYGDQQRRLADRRQRVAVLRAVELRRSLYVAEMNQ